MHDAHVVQAAGHAERIADAFVALQRGFVPAQGFGVAPLLQVQRTQLFLGERLHVGRARLGGPGDGGLQAALGKPEGAGLVIGGALPVLGARQAVAVAKASVYEGGAAQEGEAFGRAAGGEARHAELLQPEGLAGGIAAGGCIPVAHRPLPAQSVRKFSCAPPERVGAYRGRNYRRSRALRLRAAAGEDRNKGKRR